MASCRCSSSEESMELEEEELLVSVKLGREVLFCSRRGEVSRPAGQKLVCISILMLLFEYGRKGIPGNKLPPRLLPHIPTQIDREGSNARKYRRYADWKLKYWSNQQGLDRRIPPFQIRTLRSRFANPHISPLSLHSHFTPYLLPIPPTRNSYNPILLAQAPSFLLPSRSQSVCCASESKIYLAIINKGTNLTMASQGKPPSPLPLPHRKDSDSDEEEIMIKNIQTGSTENSRTLIGHHSSLLIDQTSPGSVWGEYFKSITKIEDRLLELVVRRNIQQLETLLAEFPLELSKFKYMDGWSLLHFSVSQNDVPTTELLLKFGIDVDLQSDTMKRSALHQSALANKIEITRTLVLWGANPNLQDVDRNTAIHFAVDYSYPEIVKIILTSSTPVDLNIRNCTNMTTFNTCRNPDIFELLITYSQKMPKAHSTHSQQTATSNHESPGQIYQSRLRIRNSDVIPNISRVDQVEKFLSLRENPMERKVSNAEDSIISEESMEDSFVSQEQKRINKNKAKRGVGSYLKNNAIMRSCRKASQNIGLVRQTIFKSYLDNEELIENYDKVKKLGQGSFAEVFLVRKKKSSLIYAMKKIDKKLIINNKLEKYIRAEKKVLTEIKHPFILKGYHCLQNFTHLFILMELCQGGDLEKYVRKDPLDEIITRTYVCEMALALEELHQHGILYRDLKVSNVLIDRQGHAKLADFGLTKEATLTDSFVGSVSYLPPEMLVPGEKKPHTKALDWYLLGLFLYELIHGQPPYYEQDREQMQERVLNEPPVYQADLSPGCKQAINRLLEKDPAKRINSLAELKQLDWFKDTNWQSILKREGPVMKIPQIDSKQLRRKEYFEEQPQDKLIDEKIEWFQDWNYPKKQ